MLKKFLQEIFCVEENGVIRPSMTKTGAAFKYLSASVGGAASTISYVTNNHKAALITAVMTGVLSCIGAFFEKVGERNAMGKK